MTTTNRTSHPIALRDATVTDPFWASRQELVRTQVIPYQWNALNDNVPGAAPSYCMHNFKAAAAQNAEHHKEGKAFVPPKYTFRGFEALPDDPAHPDPDKFYGFVFQDTDFSKWIEAVGYSLTHHPDADLEATADTAIDIVCAAQLDNGYLDTYYILNGMDRHFTNLKDHHELYCFGHLTEGAIAYYQATGKRKLLDAACRFADYIDSRFGTADGKLHGYPGHEIAEMALVKLTETTGEQRYADLAEYFVRQRGQQPPYFELEDRRRAREDGMLVYEIEFVTAGAEYEYEIDAVTGAIRERSIETRATAQPAASSYIGVDQAKSIALKHAGLSAAEVSFTKAKLEKDDGLRKYEIEFIKGSTEYEYEIDAATGSVLEYDVERSEPAPSNGNRQPDRDDDHDDDLDDDHDDDDDDDD